MENEYNTNNKYKYYHIIGDYAKFAYAAFDILKDMILDNYFSRHLVLNIFYQDEPCKEGVCFGGYDLSCNVTLFLGSIIERYYHLDDNGICSKIVSVLTHELFHAKQVVFNNEYLNSDSYHNLIEDSCRRMASEFLVMNSTLIENRLYNKYQYFIEITLYPTDFPTVGLTNFAKSPILEPEILYPYYINSIISGDSEYYAKLLVAFNDYPNIALSLNHNMIKLKVQNKVITRNFRRFFNMITPYMVESISYDYQIDFIDSYKIKGESFVLFKVELTDCTTLPMKFYGREIYDQYWEK